VVEAYATRATDLGDHFELSGTWLGDIWSSDSPVKVLKQADMDAFFSQPKLPCVLPGDQSYVQRIEKNPKSRGTLALHWAIAYMHHPVPAMIAATLGARIPFNTVGIWGTVPYLMTHGNAQVEEAAISAVWKHAKESSLEILFNNLASRGMIGSGINFQRGRWAAERMLAVCPEDCAPAVRKEFERLAASYFGLGPGVTVSKPAASAEPARKSEDLARYKGTEKKPSGDGSIFVYEVYEARNKQDALAFLETKNVTQELHYVIVETPEGNWGKDKMGVFKE
jgi:hypothetical protein